MNGKKAKAIRKVAASIAKKKGFKLDVDYIQLGRSNSVKVNPQTKRGVYLDAKKFVKEREQHEKKHR